MNINKRCLSIIIFSLTFFVEGYSQTASICANTLRKARTTYDEGKLHELPDILKSCLQNGFTDEEKTEAYRLLVLSYIYLDEPEYADQAMLDLLHVSKEFAPNVQTDPSEFINLYKTFRTKPLFRYGIAGGANTTMVNVISTNRATNNSDGKYGTLVEQLSFQGGLVFEKDLFRKFTLKSSVLYLSKKTFHTWSAFPDEITGVNNSSSETTESQAWIALDNLAQYKLFPKSSLNLYVTLGPSVQYLIANTRAITITNEQGSGEKGADVNLLENGTNNRLDIGIKAGAGIKRKFGLNFFTFELTYLYGLIDITDKNFETGELTWRYAQGSNRVNLHQIQLSAGLLLQWFSPKKLED